MTIFILLGIIIMLIFWTISNYNKIISNREMVNNSMGQIAAQLESRWDALSSIIKATKDYSEHESKVLYDLTSNRTGINRNSNVEDIDKDEEIFNKVLRELNVVVENYPDLKASVVYKDAMEKIDKYENNVRQSRMIYNDTVTKYNRSILVFPASIIANIFNFKEEDYFEGTSHKKEMPSWD